VTGTITLAEGRQITGTLQKHKSGTEHPHPELHAETKKTQHESATEKKLQQKSAKQ
jgi:hypothetical protein